MDHATAGECRRLVDGLARANGDIADAVEMLRCSAATIDDLQADHRSHQIAVLRELLDGYEISLQVRDLGDREPVVELAMRYIDLLRHAEGIEVDLLDARAEGARLRGLLRSLAVLRNEEGFMRCRLCLRFAGQGDNRVVHARGCPCREEATDDR